MPQAIKSEAMRSYIGYAALDKEANSRLLQVYCPELLPFTSGQLTATDVSNDVHTVSTRTGDRQTSIKSTNFITAEYRGEDTNRGGPPNVRKGEEVVVYTFGDHNQFYWKSSARNDANRRTETYRLQISGTLTNTPTMSDDNTYFFEMDTRDSHRIRISTSKQDGEQYRYLFQIDADKGMITLSDDAGNMVYIDSTTPQVSMKNAKNSLLELNGENICMMCKKDITIISDAGNINLDARNGTYKQHSKADMTMASDNTMHQTSKADMTIVSEANRAISVKQNQTLDVSGNLTTQVQGNTTHTVSGNMSHSTNGTTTISSTGVMSLSTSATMTITSNSNMALRAGGGLSISFNGSGTMTGNGGGSLTMQLSRLQIHN